MSKTSTLDFVLPLITISLPSHHHHHYRTAITSSAMAGETTPHNSAIVCACLTGPKRAPEDLLGVRYGAELVWFRMPCKGYLAEDLASDTKAIVYCAQRTTPEMGDIKALMRTMLAVAISQDTTEQSAKRVHRLTTVLHCDRPRRGSTDHETYF